MKSSKEKKRKEVVKSTDADRSERIKRKAAGASTNESSVAAELKNLEHGNEQPAR